MRVVVLGGAGNFGARIIRALRDEPGLQLICAGRRAVRVPGAPDVPVAQVDIHGATFPSELAGLAPDLVIHCVGPFQGQDYRVARAALAAGSHYLDLADGRAFVEGFAAAIHDQAVRQGRTAITGASTLPALSCAVIDALTTDMQTLDSIGMVIAPGQHAPRGAATLAALFSYLGRPVRLWRAGRWQQSWGWMDLQRFDLGFGARWGALCDVPDLGLLPRRYAGVHSVEFRAALEIPLQQLVLWGFAALRRAGVPLPLERWAGALDRMASAFDRCGGEWGGMQVHVSGSSASGHALRRSWTLRAPVLRGPEIPCMAAILLTRRLARGGWNTAGAFPCMGFLRLADFSPLFERWGITTQIA